MKDFFCLFPFRWKLFAATHFAARWNPWPPTWEHNFRRSIFLDRMLYLTRWSCFLRVTLFLQSNCLVNPSIKDIRYMHWVKRDIHTSFFSILERIRMRKVISPGKLHHSLAIPQNVIFSYSTWVAYPFQKLNARPGLKAFHPPAKLWAI